MQEIRRTAVAGLFYPSSPQELLSVVGELLEKTPGRADPKTSPKAVIAPHAGYVYSGPIAGSALAPLRQAAERISKIVLLGPAHRVPVRGLALPGADGFETPLGIVPVDAELVDEVIGLSQVGISRAAHAPEHSLEVELPFLQVLLGRFSILPLLVGDATPGEVADVLERVWGGPETRIVISSDLSHYLEYSQAQRVDEKTAEEVLALRSPISPNQACGAGAINGLLVTALSQDLSASLLDLRNSGDTAGDRSQVVGYGAFSFAEPN
jgi:AmmeMemoRadiSam system protein B